MTRALLALLLFPVFAFGWTPSQADLDAALSLAKLEWGRNVEVVISFVPADSCGLYGNVKEAISNPMDLNKTMAVTGKIGTRLAFDDGSMGPISYSYTIHVNAACAWTPAHLRSIVLHEYGHVLGIMEHSHDPLSIMYWIVYDEAAGKKYGKQTITPVDREMVKGNL